MLVMWKYCGSPENLKKIKWLLRLKLLQKTKMGEYLKSWNRTQRLWELSPDLVKDLTGCERGQRLTDRQTEQRLFPYENECRAKRTAEPDTRFSFIMSFSGNNLSQRQNGDASSFQQMQRGEREGWPLFLNEWKWPTQGYPAQVLCLI